MKISCQSCHSKYNVADDKVQGKIVKIRCRKCGATIVVNASAGASSNGSAPAPAPRAPTGAMADVAHGGGFAEAMAPAVGAGAAAGEWHVSVSDSDQRTMSLAELVGAYHAGDIAQDVFIWTEGMDDWKPLGEVDAVVSALYAFGAVRPGGEPVVAPSYSAPPPVAAVPSYSAPLPAPELELGGGERGGGLAAHAHAVPVQAPEPKRAAVVKREARARDLFATRSGEELPGTAPAAGGDDERLTGQRNENSVLFSLDHLTRNAAGPPPREEPIKPQHKDDSGLIDLQALVAKAESMRPQAMPQSHLLAPPLGGFTAPLGAPMGTLGPGTEAQPKSKLPLLVGAGAGLVLLMVLCIVIGLKIGGAASPTVATATSATASAVPSAATAEPVPSTSASAQAAASASAAPAATAPKHAFAAGGGGTWKPNAGAGAGMKPAGGGGAAGAAPAGGGGGATPAPAGKKGDCGCNGDLMCMMKCSTH